VLEVWERASPGGRCKARVPWVVWRPVAGAYDTRPGYCPNLKRMSDVSLRGHGVSEAIPPFFAVPRTERLPRSRWSLAMGIKVMDC